MVEVRYDAVNDTFEIVGLSRHQVEVLDTCLYRWFSAIRPEVRKMPYFTPLVDMMEVIKNKLLSFY